MGQWRHLFGSKTFTEVKYTGWWGFFDLNPETLYDGDPSTQPLRFDETGAHLRLAGLRLLRGPRPPPGARVDLALRRGLRPPRPQVRRGGRAQPHPRPQRLRAQRRLLLRLRRRALPGLQTTATTSRAATARESVFAQDSWKVNDRLTLNPGVRLDHVAGRHPDGEDVYTNDQHRAAVRLRLRRHGRPQDRAQGQLQPVLRGDLQRHLQAGHARAGATTSPTTPAAARRSRPSAGSAGWSEIDRTPAAVYGIDPDLKHPRVDETSLGFERALSNDVRLSVTGIYRDNKNIVGSVNPAGAAGRRPRRHQRPGPDP